MDGLLPRALPVPPTQALNRPGATLAILIRSRGRQGAGRPLERAVLGTVPAMQASTWSCRNGILPMAHTHVYTTRSTGGRIDSTTVLYPLLPDLSSLPPICHLTVFSIHRLYTNIHTHKYTIAYRTNYTYTVRPRLS